VEFKVKEDASDPVFVAGRDDEACWLTVTGACGFPAESATLPIGVPPHPVKRAVTITDDNEDAKIWRVFFDVFFKFIYFIP